MKKVFVVLIVVAGLVLAFGFYRGWFSMDNAKIKADEQKTIEKGKEVGGEIREGIRKGMEKAKEETKK